MATGAKPRSSFFLYMTFLFLAIALTGFSTTFFIPLARGTFHAPPVIHVHGVFVFGWLLFLIWQALLIRQRKGGVHRRLGWLGAGIAVGVVVTAVLVGLHATRRDLAAGGDAFILGQFVNILIEMAIFGGMVGAAIIHRRKPEVHKRLLMLATISALAPAWLRFRHFMPFVPNPFVTFSLLADSLLLVAIARDWIVLKRVHPVYLWAGGAMVALHVIETMAIRSGPWLWMARWLLGDAASGVPQ